MTEAERERLSADLKATQSALSAVELISRDDEEALYQAFKSLHTAALGPYCTLCQIWEERRGIDPVQRRREDEINLNELFGEKENTCGN